MAILEWKNQRNEFESSFKFILGHRTSLNSNGTYLYLYILTSTELLSLAGDTSCNHSKKKKKNQVSTDLRCLTTDPWTCLLNPLGNTGEQGTGYNQP